MKTLFTAIRKREIEKIKELITKQPALVNCIAKQPPKKDDGQSPLQIAFKTGNFWAVKYFLENGADINFIDATSVNEWKMPVLHDAVMATVALARFEYPVDPWNEEKKDVYELKGVKEHFEKTFSLLKMMVDNGADVNSVDSYGNSVLMRACSDIQNRSTIEDRPLAKETVEDLRQIFDLLISSGADLNYSATTRKSVVEMNKKLLEQLKIEI
ncbi:ankyrin repeat domain-containing protein [Chryseobacterium formosus]|uniref:Ankyrin repeat domain-containing protein n=1 Tax=Chryseobacterium formosus TaxID=1537363 RepID=A0ABT3XRB4_9FLAO|nr:ankyrin repeat domain-containing protein [Chryseobacterium formosus]MCX8524645.1 ankyrin repeat domain-containing protein [Chryseobacterium formosus]